ncbi:hypothetical protein LINPERPRIM_LOCUS30265, partial [Linum perenne]
MGYNGEELCIPRRSEEEEIQENARSCKKGCGTSIWSSPSTVGNCTWC